ncbi:MAG: hypothetical protein SEPTF4163_004218 [Sporothrix epigloea]
MNSQTSNTDSSLSAEPSHIHATNAVDGSGASVPLATGMDANESSVQPGIAEGERQNLDSRSKDLPDPSSQSLATPRGTPTGPSQLLASSANVQQQSSSSSAHLSGLMCNVHRTTGSEPHPLVGATTTILGDKLYVFGGRILSRSRPASLTSDLYELDLIRRHWTKVATSGDIPPPRYFHSMCALGDSKMVCYGGMSTHQNVDGSSLQDQQDDVTVMSDIHIYDVPTRKWTSIQTQETPQGRYAHCACILPSSATFSSHRAPLSALQHNPSTGTNEGRIGINIDGTGGAEMVVVGGQDGANHYIEQVSVFNLRSLKWTSTEPLGRSCGAYRSVVAPLTPSVTARIGRTSAVNAASNLHPDMGGISQEAREPGSSMLVYSNYNFLDVKLELQIRSPDGTLSEKPMAGTYTPPGLRFPNGGIIDTHFVVSGTYLTSSKQEYALWALDLRSLTWSRIDAGGSVFSQGSWNRGVLWNRRNSFVILGNRKRSLVDDYNHRRINFTNVCVVELEAFGFYDNPRKTAPMSGFVSASSPYTNLGLSIARKAGSTAGGRFHSRASEDLGEKALALRELADMDVLCIGGERIPVNSRIVARRWGPYFVQLLREGTAVQDSSGASSVRPFHHSAMRSSITTITPSSRSTMESTTSNSSAPTNFGSSASKALSTPGTSISGNPSVIDASLPVDPATINTAPTPRTLPPNSRPRCLYLPHTYLTVQALLHFLYTGSLASPIISLCTPQILCSLLQIARPYRVDGLLEAVVERLHALLDSRNAAAVFNATAMAAGGGRGIDGTLNPNFSVPTGGLDVLGTIVSTTQTLLPAQAQAQTQAQAQVQSQTQVQARDDQSQQQGDNSGLVGATAGLQISTTLPSSANGGQPGSGEQSAATSVAGSDWSSEVGDNSERGQREVWSGELSSVIGLQKRGLKGLMEGRRLRERTDTNQMAASNARIGLDMASA